MRSPEAILLFNNKVLLAAAVRMGETPMPR